MPYIKQKRRQHFDKEIAALLQKLRSSKARAGDINYCLSRLLKELWKDDECYERANELLGILNAVNLELYRKCVAPYEDVKETENGRI